MLTSLRHSVETLTLFASLTLLGVICLVWTVFALPLWIVLPQRLGIPCGRWGILVGFRLYVWSLRLMGAYRLDLAALSELRGGPAVVLAPNHPSLIDALLIIAHDPNVACVMKSSLMNNLFLGAGARLAGYIRNEPTRRMIAGAIEELARGGVVLLFPEGTRTVQAPINPLKASVGIIARHAGVPVQTLIIEQDRAFLSKGWSLFRRPTLPVTYRMRLGRRFDPPTDVRAFTVELEQYYRAELARSEQNRWIEDRPTARSSG
ncbi:MAG TPA: lysophospholipid acyltransferase family protein [Steroidobacteraceae bacterium]|nr:lysophospholipid acyltransferase family protein [Steroidobacteraceae bacterium]